MSEITDEFLADARERMQKSVEACRHELATVRTGRASPHLLDRLEVDYYGAVTPIKQLAQVAVRNIRRDVMHDLRELKKEGEVGEDDERRAEADLQKRTDDATKEIDELLKAKEEEILEV
jgi:ribosome recycling factor